MGIEREIKLALPPGQADAAAQYFCSCTGTQGRDVPLDNVYFDTPSLALTHAKMALRLRKTPDGWLQTLKAAGTATGGLHSRHEWETPVTGPALELDVLAAACDDEAACATLRGVASELTALFRTTFVRRLWRVSAGDATIEAAIDRGEVTAEVNGETRRSPISEVELELVDGSESALGALAADLSANVPGLAPDDVNKAQRGYALRMG
ncbi:CYTH domain-containing protein [Trinickia caryophylli]|uniref:Adenylate cyclase n=1 Tax=Trinickia caryophylli TaxID=28094 RepID=A0A1X7F240_TRICW|nr:CYTH domain-containing protein [Trinickia caryophylli]PMS10338.1 CYTH domain-containing protein [Trinickia caryophylli]TRX19541.1 CYTH domain-containing protein [Trinickia caryophylli]WQE13149.1 CYTH domain-containing protein [Trinickia caryophylli]SMF43962.1 adenylate cyclase [Trinickia caryophylli]GLU34551.1 CYTH domain-containing protein [Trinickia caryophylli]